MSVRFVIGRAGTGKTHHCLEAIRNQLRHNPIDGPKLIFLVPEQASLQMERAIVEPADIGGAHRAEVLSFRRLAFRILSTIGAEQRQALTEPARAMVLRYLLRNLSGKLNYYKRVERLGGFTERLAATIAELIQENVHPSDITVSLDDELNELDPTYCAKMHDVATLYEAYLAYLGDEKLDPSQYLEVARGRLRECDWLAGAEVWLDGFASLSQQEELTLMELTRLAHHVEFTMLVDPQLSVTLGNESQYGATSGLFSKTQETYARLVRSFEKAGTKVEERIALRPKTVPRFAHHDTLAQLEKHLFVPRKQTVQNENRPQTDLQCVELPSQRHEVDFAVAKICDWVRASQNPLRYRDIAIIARDLDSYHDLFREALSAANIPHFVDSRRSIAHHPLVELLRSGIALAAEDVPLDATRRLLKTGILPIDDNDADELENTLIARGVHGVSAWHAEWKAAKPASWDGGGEEDQATLSEETSQQNDLRRQFIKATSCWFDEVVNPVKRTGQEWVRFIEGWFMEMNVGTTLAQWANLAEADGLTDVQVEHEQCWRDVLSFLEDLAFAFADTTLNIEELAGIMDHGLSSLTLALAPPMLDQVLVGSVERSRHPDIKAAVIVGFNDGSFPKKLTEDTILNDDDRRILRDAGLTVASPTSDRLVDEGLLAYIALTRASKKTVITYAATGNDGKQLRPSSLLDEVLNACPGLQVQKVGDPASHRLSWDIVTTNRLAQRLVTEFHLRRTKDTDENTSRRRWNELYESQRSQLSQDSAFRRSSEASLNRHSLRLSPSNVQELHGNSLRTSVSQLEAYATCPFRHFAKRSLRIQERSEAKLAAVDIGGIHHAVLQVFLDNLCEQQQIFSQLSEDQLESELQRACDKVATRLPTSAEIFAPRDRYLLRRSAMQLGRVLRAQRASSQGGSTNPKAAELPFGFDKPKSLPALEIVTPAGRRVTLRGYIDRIDVAEHTDELLGVVIDYKRKRNKSLALESVYHGLSLQLLSYVLVLAEHGQTLTGRAISKSKPIRPIGAFFVSTTSQYNSVEHPSLASARDQSLSGSCRQRGILAAEDFVTLDSSTSGGWSEHFNIYLKKDGSIGLTEKSDGLDRSSFGSLLAHVQHKIGELADRMLDGHVDVSPYRLGNASPCSWCSIAEVCRFEMGISDVRYLQSMSRREIFNRIAVPLSDVSVPDQPKKE